VVGKAAGDTKLESERKAERIEDKVHNAIGGRPLASFLPFNRCLTA
jgi:hypothetical protein